MRFLLLAFVCLFGTTLFGQRDSIIVVSDRPDGIYLTYKDFRKNNYLSNEHIVSTLSKDQLDFMSKVVDGGKFTYTTTAGSMTAESKDIWGFYQNKTLYINFKGEFFRVPVFGSICYLVATVTVVSGFYDPMFGYGVNARRTKEIREFIINYYDGIMTDFTIEKAEILLSRDAAIYDEYKNLNRKQRREQLNRYIRRFNEAHPVYFLR